MAGGVVFARPNVTVAGGGGGGGEDAFLFDVAWTNDGGSTASGQRLRRTVGFAPAAVPSGMFAELRKSDGTTAYTRQQFDQVTYWSDGSMKSAVLTVEQEDNVATTATQTDKMWVVAETAASNTSAITNQNLKDLAYTFVITSGGTDYTFSVSDAIDDGSVRNFAVGPVERQIRVFGYAENSGTPNTALFCLGWISLLRDGTTSAAYFRLISHWDEDFGGTPVAPGTGTITALRTKKSGSDVQAYTSLSYNMQGGMAQDVAEEDFSAVWTANAPTMRAVIDPAQAFEALLIPPQRVRSEIVTEIGNPSPDTLTPFDLYDVEPSVGGTGGRPDIGWYAGWVGRALIANKKNLTQQLYANASGTNTRSMHYYVAAYGEPVVARTETYGSIVGDARASSTDNSNAGWWIDNTAGSSPISSNNYDHYATAAYGAFLFSGEPWHFETALVDATNAVLSHDANYREKTLPNSDNFKSVTLWQIQPRSGAWGFGCIANANHILPASHPLRDYITDVYADNKGWLNSICKTANLPTEALALGVPTLLLTLDDGYGWSVRWFQFNFIMFDIGMERLRGNFTDSDEFVVQAVNKNYFGIATAADGGCRSRADAYTINFCIENGTGHTAGDIAESWDDVAIADAGTGWDDTTKLIPSGGCPSSGTLSSFADPHNYSVYRKAVAALWERAGNAKAEAEADYLDGEYTSQGGPTDANWALNPQFDLERAA